MVNFTVLVKGGSETSKGASTPDPCLGPRLVFNTPKGGKAPAAGKEQRRIWLGLFANLLSAPASFSLLCSNAGLTFLRVFIKHHASDAPSLRTPIRFDAAGQQNEAMTGCFALPEHFLLEAQRLMELLNGGLRTRGPAGNGRNR